MASSFPDSFDQLGADSPTPPFDDDAYLGYDPPRPPPPIYVSGGGSGSDLPEMYPESNGQLFESEYFVGSDDGPIFPPPDELQSEEGFALREWRRQNAIRLEGKEKKEKELLNQIIEEANEYKVDFYRKRQISCETNKATTREKEKLFLTSQEKFHSEADKNYWKAIAELVPNDMPAIEKKRGKKDKEKNPSVTVIQGPKPGKLTDLSRMRQILIKLKHNTPPHLKPSPPPPPALAKDSKNTVAVSTTPEAVAVA